MYDIFWRLAMWMSRQNFRIELPGIHFEDQKYRNGNVQTITELMEQYHRIWNQSSNKQNVNNAQNKEAETVLKMKLRGKSRGKLHEGQEELSGSSHSDKMVLVTVRQGAWTAWAVAKGNLRGRHNKSLGGELPGLSPLRSNGSRGSQARMRTAWAVAKDAQMKVRKRL
jgi:hypothetical protein